MVTYEIMVNETTRQIKVVFREAEDTSYATQPLTPEEAIEIGEALARTGHEMLAEGK